MEAVSFLLALATTYFATVTALAPCPGDTRLERTCDFDGTHRVCAKIGVQGTSFWKFTGQQSWCNTRGYYGGKYGSELRCPAERPSWCICKWATASWIKQQGCDDTIQINCAATDVCDVKQSYFDYGHDMKPAHECMAKKCPAEWAACGDVKAPVCADRYSNCGMWARMGYCKKQYVGWMESNCKKSCGKCPN